LSILDRNNNPFGSTIVVTVRANILFGPLIATKDSLLFFKHNTSLLLNRIALVNRMMTKTQGADSRKAVLILILVESNIQQTRIGK